MKNKAFTLIELLVVIAIIAILAAILFPVFAQAKVAAKKSADLSNMKQIGIALQLYLNDYDDVYSQAYYYINDNNSQNGYAQWSGMLQPYIKNWNIFVSPNDKLRGLAPTNYQVSTNNMGFGWPTGQTPQYDVQDIQAPRLSYTVNSLVMARKRRTVDPMSVVSTSVLDDVSGTILVAAMTDNPQCINDSSAASGQAYKTHRSTNAIKMLDNSVFAGEAPAQVGLSAYRAVSVAEAKAGIAACSATGGSANNQYHIVYTSPERFGNGANYVHCDTSAKFLSLGATLNPTAFRWGKRAYTAGGGVIYKPGAGTDPVQ